MASGVGASFTGCARGKTRTVFLNQFFTGKLLVTSHAGASAGVQGVNLRKFALSLVALLAAGVSASASSWEFEVENASDASVTMFRTMEDGNWSRNWLKTKIEPGETFDMDFGHDSGDCEVRTQINFSDGSHFDSKVDYCSASKLTIFNNRVEWE